jgi:hypothetical protein
MPPRIIVTPADNTNGTRINRISYSNTNDTLLARFVIALSQKSRFMHFVATISHTETLGGPTMSDQRGVVAHTTIPNIITLHPITTTNGTMSMVERRIDPTFPFTKHRNSKSSAAMCDIKKVATPIANPTTVKKVDPFVPTNTAMDIIDRKMHIFNIKQLVVQQQQQHHHPPFFLLGVCIVDCPLPFIFLKIVVIKNLE